MWKVNWSASQDRGTKKTTIFIHFIQRPPGVWEVMSSIPVGDSDVFFLPRSCVDSSSLSPYLRLLPEQWWLQTVQMEYQLQLVFWILHYSLRFTFEALNIVKSTIFEVNQNIQSLREKKQLPTCF